MKIITEPKVAVVGHSVSISHPDYKVPWGQFDSHADILCSFAAKGCYDSFGAEGRPNVDNQRQIISTRHGSVLEHFTISVFIEGITRALSLELNRHRGFAISQRSTRYTAEEDAAIVLDPYYASIYNEYQHIIERFGQAPGMPMLADWRGHPATLVWGHIIACRHVVTAYQAEVENLIARAPDSMSKTEARKWARGKARNLLPHALETRGTYTANLRSWRWFLELRSEPHAEAEIRRLTNRVWDAIYPIAPTHFEDFVVIEHDDGLSQLIPQYSKI